MKECIACAEEIKEGAKLCRHCGTEQTDPRFQSGDTLDGQDADAEKQEAHEETAGSTEPESNKIPQPARPIGISPSKSAKTKKFIWGSVATFTLAALVVAYAYPGITELQDEQNSPARSQETSQGAAVEDSRPIGPKSLWEALGFELEALEEQIGQDDCKPIQEAILESPLDENLDDRLTLLSEFDSRVDKGTYRQEIREGTDFITTNQWVLDTANVFVYEYEGPVTVAAMQSYRSLLESSSFEGASNLEKNYPSAYAKFAVELSRELASVCGFGSKLDQQHRLTTLSRKLVERVSQGNETLEAIWWPEGFYRYSFDSNLAWAWADGRCSGSGVCWHMQVVSKLGCQSLYAEISISDASGNLVDWSNDTARSLRSGQIAVLEFRSFEGGRLTGRLTDLSCIN